MPSKTFPDTPTVVHRRLNTTFHGFRHPVWTSKYPVEQFRGIKYGHIPARFRRCRIVSSYPAKYDATKNGPIAPQIKFREIEQNVYGLHPTQYPIEQFKQDEFECLNLNITAPAYLSPNSKLPVMVWVHGGGNVGGAGSRWLLDGGNLVRRSLEVGKPIIIVALNYRLGLFGFAASPALQKDNAAAGDKGVGNYALHDQLQALRWIHANISEFGGDSGRITVCGEGKGACDVHALLIAGVGRHPKLVHRAILQSGTCPPTLPSPGQQQVELCRVMASLNITTVDELRAVPADVLVQACVKNSIRIGPTEDGSFFPLPHSRSQDAANDLGIDAILIGDTHNEAGPYTVPASKWSSCALTRRVKAVLRSPYKSDALIRAFDVSEEAEKVVGHEEIAERVGELIGDCLVAYGVERLSNFLAEASQSDESKIKTKVYRFTFDQPSPFNSSAHHSVDLVYLFGNIDFAGGSGSDSDDCFVDTDSEKRVSRIMQTKWIEFVNGKAVWGEYSPLPPVNSSDEDEDEDGPLPATPEGEGEIYIFGPTGDTYPAPVSELGWRRRVDKWREAFEDSGEVQLEDVFKVGMELANGPTNWIPKGRK